MLFKLDIKTIEIRFTQDLTRFRYDLNKIQI